MFCRVSKVVVVFMSALTWRVHMAAIYTWKGVGMRPFARTNLHIDSLASLNLVPITGMHRQGAITTPCTRIQGILIGVRVFAHAQSSTFLRAISASATS